MFSKQFENRKRQPRRSKVLEKDENSKYGCESNPRGNEIRKSQNKNRKCPKKADNSKMAARATLAKENASFLPKKLDQEIGKHKSEVLKKAENRKTAA